MLSNRLLIALLTLLSILLLSACNTINEAPQEHMDTEDMPIDEMDEDDGHMGMDHSGSGEVPDNLQEAQNPTFEVGTQVNIEADHMSGMSGAEATVVGAYDTIVYAISYTPTDGGNPVKNHKWVIHEELENPGSEPLKAGDEATVSADHMAGMNGARVTIDSADETTVYMIDFMPLDGGDQVTNHKWVTEAELSPVE
ncbi:YdhK family protein [Planococcus sp. X10-3]|uniref:YdhK family protein n=1 Tax=Planococcus sp. X10-3 TaxID=3061240 RepID=UPI003BAE3A2A